MIKMCVLKHDSPRAKNNITNVQFSKALSINITRKNK